MTILAFPTLSKATPHRFEWWGSWPSQSSPSPFDGSDQTYELGALRWQIVMGWDNLSAADEGLLSAFEAQMRGLSGRVYLWNMARPVPRGTISLSGVTLGGSVAAGATTCALAGCGAGGTLLPGDLIAFGTELKRITATATANGSGAIASASFEPPARAAHSNGAGVTTNKPKAVFRFEAERQGGGFRPTAQGVLGTRTYQLIESFTGVA